MASSNVTIIIVSLVMMFLCGVGESRGAFACDPKNGVMKTQRFCKISLPIHVRVKDLIGRLTLKEKIRLLVNNAVDIPRLGIQRYEWWSEALHGVSDVGPGTKFGGPFPGATMFPQVITTAASFNSSLFHQIGRVVSDEARAMYNGGRAGLTFWSPNVNIFRDPRWGRGQETPGEDPVLASSYGASYVSGLQDNSGEHLKVAACCKHYTAYDLDHWNNVDRFHFNARVSRQDLEETYNVPFEACVSKGKVASVMCSYNQVNGKPTCADPHLLRNTIRRRWKLNGYIVSDCDSVKVLFKNQHYTATPEEAVAVSIKSGLDLDCGAFLAIYSDSAIRKKLLSESDVDRALANIITVQMRLGMFNGDPSAQRYGELGPRVVCDPAHNVLAVEAAQQGIVLLKNRGQLPLSPQRHRLVSVIGPNSDATTTMIGNYAGIACGYTSPLRGIGNYVKTAHQAGCDNIWCRSNTKFGEAETIARHSDATVLVMGLDQSIEAEGRDRVDLVMPGHQQELVSRVALASKGPVVLVLMSGGPIDVTFAKNDPRIAAIMWVGYPGQSGGVAIADVIFGRVNPSGKLPMTWYPQDYIAKVPMTNMAMRPNLRRGYPGRTYKFYKGPVVFPFGHGLSYSTFVHSLVKQNAPTKLNVAIATFKNNTMSRNAIKANHANCAIPSASLEFDLDVENKGEMDGLHTLLVYSSPPDGHHWSSNKRLLSFHKVHILAGSEQRVRIEINACEHLSVIDRDGIQRIPIGEHNLYLGDIKHSITVKEN